tara:strand:- start:879 stop:1769 length:891 start_codon:yes stop_codon:yes gene_type:complete
VKVYGVSRNSNSDSFFNKLRYIDKNADSKNIELIKADLRDKNITKKLVDDINPDSIINLSGPSSVYESFKNENIKENIITIFNNLVDACIESSIFPEFFQASSSEMYGLNKDPRLDENSNFIPNSPYAEGKLENHNKILSLREKHNWNLVSGILFNHESEFRDSNYLFSKIINYLIDKDKKKPLSIGSLDYERDWSYAGDIMKYVSLINLQKFNENFVIGSGIPTSIKTLLEISFDSFNLDFSKYVEINENLLRKNDPIIRVANIEKLNTFFKSKIFMPIEDIVERVVKYKVNLRN